MPVRIQTSPVQEVDAVISLNQEDAITVQAVLGLCALDKDCYRILGNLAEVVGEFWDDTFDRFTIGKDACGGDAIIPSEFGE